MVNPLIPNMHPVMHTTRTADFPTMELSVHAGGTQSMRTQGSHGATGTHDGRASAAFASGFKSGSATQ